MENRFDPSWCMIQVFRKRGRAYWLTSVFLTHSVAVDELWWCVGAVCLSVCISVCLRTETVTEMDAAFTREPFADAPYFSPCQVRREREQRKARRGYRKGEEREAGCHWVNVQ